MVNGDIQGNSPTRSVHSHALMVKVHHENGLGFRVDGRFQFKSPRVLILKAMSLVWVPVQYSKALNAGSTVKAHLKYCPVVPI